MVCLQSFAYCLLSTYAVAHSSRGTWTKKTQALHQVTCILAGAQDADANPTVAWKPRWAGEQGRAGRGAGGRRWRRAQHGPVGLCREASRRGRSAALCSASRRLRSVRHGRGSAETSTGGPGLPRPAAALRLLQRRLWEAATARARAGRCLPAPRGENHVSTQRWLHASRALGS